MGSIDLEQVALAFVQKDYELKMNYLSAHFSRMWTRFNFFLVLESGLSAALWLWFKDKGVFTSQAVALAWVGLATSVCWYLFGAQDRYLVEVYRKHVGDAGAIIAEKLGLRDYLGSNYVHVGDQSTKITQNVYQWRLELLSTTKLAAWFPLLVILYWISMIVLTSKSAGFER